MSNQNLGAWYGMTYQIVQNSNFTLTEIEGMIVFERDIFYDMLKTDIEKKRKNP